MPIELPAMPEDQQEAWQAVFQIYDGMPQGWVLIGGQAVYLHAIERAAPNVRATTMLTSPLTSGATPRCSTTSRPCWKALASNYKASPWRDTSTGGSEERPRWTS